MRPRDVDGSPPRIGASSRLTAIGDRGPGLGAEAARLEVAAAARRARRRRGTRGRGRRRSGSPRAARIGSSAPVASSATPAPSSSQPADRRRRPSALEPGRGGDEHAPAVEAVRAAAERLALAHAGDRPVGQASRRGRARRASPAPQMPSAVEAHVALELAQRARRCRGRRCRPRGRRRSRGALSRRCSSATSSPRSIGRRQVEQPVAEAEAALDQRGPGLAVRRCRRPAARGAPGRRAPTRSVAAPNEPASTAAIA